MLTKVEARTSQGTLLSLPLDDISGGFVVQNIDGLDPVKATIVTSTFAQLAGESYQSSRREARNIKMQVGLQPDYSTTSVRDLRTILYGFFMPESPVELRFYDSDGLIVNISGRVETFETAIFSKEPAVDISIMCFNPDFVELSQVTFNGVSVADSTESLLTYPGSVKAGFLFTLNLDRTLSAFTFYNRLPDGTLQTLNFAGSLLSGDVLKISTIPGAKSAILTRTGSDSSVLYGVDKEPDWPALNPGSNNVRVYAAGAAGIPFTIQYYNRYGGL